MQRLWNIIKKIGYGIDKFLTWFLIYGPCIVFLMMTALFFHAAITDYQSVLNAFITSLTGIHFYIYGALFTISLAMVAYCFEKEERSIDQVFVIVLIIGVFWPIFLLVGTLETINKIYKKIKGKNESG